MAQSPATLPSLHFPTFAFVLLCWSFPLGILTLSFGPMYWVRYEAQYYAWPPILFYSLQWLLIALFSGLLLLLSHRTTHLLMKPSEGLIPKALWIFLTAISILAVAGLLWDPELLPRMQYSLTLP
jgi:hypothetical protein